MPIGQGRLQPAGPVRMLHRLGRRGAPGRVRHTCSPCRRSPGHHARGSTGGVARPLGRRVRRSTGPASAASARRASCSAWPRSKGRARGRAPTRRDIEAALRAHLCRCTGWQSIVEAACSVLGVDAAAGSPAGRAAQPGAGRVAGPVRGAGLPDLGARRGARRRGLRRRLGARRARSSSSGRMRRSPPGSAPPAPRAGASRAATARCLSSHPVEVPEGDWALTLQTTWVEPAYVEPDASWCRPGHAPGIPAGQRGRLRGQAAQPGAGRRPGAGGCRR